MKRKNVYLFAYVVIFLIGTYVSIKSQMTYLKSYNEYQEGLKCRNPMCPGDKLCLSMGECKIPPEPAHPLTPSLFIYTVIILCIIQGNKHFHKPKE